MPLKYKVGDRVWYWQEGFYMDLFSMKSTGPYKKKEMAEIVEFTEPQYLKRSGCQYYAQTVNKKTNTARGIKYGLSEDKIISKVKKGAK